MTSVAIVNKNWEAEPVIAGMCSNDLRPANLNFPEVLLPLQDRKFSGTNPRAIFRFREDGSAKPEIPILLEIKVWCIQDLMDKTKNSSSSEEKYRVLPPMLGAEKPDLVIAAGTLEDYLQFATEVHRQLNPDK